MQIRSFIKNHYLFIIGLSMILLLAFFAFIAPYLPFVDKELKTILYVFDENRKPVVPPYPPSEEHLFGTDKQGRDLLSLIILGAKETLILVIMITVLRYAISIPLAYLAHKQLLGANALLNWLNGLFSYIPTIVVVILIAMLPPILTTEYRPYLLLLIVAFVEVGRASEMIKLEFSDISSREYINGGIAAGASGFTLLKLYYLPLLYSKLIVYMVTDLGKVMFLLAQLGFVGIFISQDLIQIETGDWIIVNDSYTWPMMLMKAFEDIRGPIWIPFFAAMAMTYTIFTFNIFSQGLQKFFNRKINYI
ncbi:peptide ABC transporter permease [Bacillus sp. 31A1R]|uniref:Peptide ABC transporter permease n=1 Tax=Robertmurraya mangrovi TaxID=3098077 RepID=A0ABU5J1D8_9BACI|nr:peptide ABC transporter permease [Bacillus sp. 31A1R]MDZ5473211.1 peptide ABC transporter permease [Bacillus sp. 31A1R]